MTTADPNYGEIGLLRAKALYSGPKSEVADWASEQVEIMTRPKAPKYHISGGSVDVTRLSIRG